jgi:ribosomal protein L37AE/L43A
MVLAIRNIFARWICAATKHTRGRRISPELVQCARCGATWARQKREKAAA